MQAMQMSFFFMLPFVFLSGYVFPIDGMPPAFQLVTYLIPARYFIEVIRGIKARGRIPRPVGADRGCPTTCPIIARRGAIFRHCCPALA
jgi:ABC-type polysaccharide/polyol phosphate export permease